MEETKKWYSSKGFWGAAIALLVAVILFVGSLSPGFADNQAVKDTLAVLQDPQAQTTVQGMADALSANETTDRIIGIIGVAGSFLALYGRVTAKAKLE